MKSLSMSIRYTFVLLLLGSLFTLAFHPNVEAADAAKPSGKTADATVAKQAAPAPAAAVVAAPAKGDKEAIMERCELPMSNNKSLRGIDPKTKVEETTNECFVRQTKGPSDSSEAQCKTAIREANDAFSKVRTACGGVDAGMSFKKCLEYNKECKEKDENTEQSTADVMGTQFAQQMAAATGTTAMPMTLPKDDTDPDEKPCPKMTYEKWQDGFKSITSSLDEANRELGKLNADYGKIDTEKEKEGTKIMMDMTRMEREFDEKNKAADADIRENIRKGVQGFNNLNAEIRALEDKVRNDQNVLVFIYQEKALLLSQGSKAIMRFECNKKLQESLKNLPTIKSGGLKNLVSRSGNLNTVKQDAINECLMALKAGREKVIREKEVMIETTKANIKNNEIRLGELRQELQLNQSHFEQAKLAAEDSKNKAAAQQSKEMMAKGQENINLLKEAQTKKQALQVQIDQQQKIVNRQSNQIAGLGAKPDADQTETGKTTQKAVSEWISKVSNVKLIENCCDQLAQCKEMGSAAGLKDEFTSGTD